jgi:hypothetical protein
MFEEVQVTPCLVHGVVGLATFEAATVTGERTPSGEIEIYVEPLFWHQTCIVSPAKEG